MKIVVLTVDHAYANYVVKSLIQTFGSDIKTIGYSSVLLHNKSLIQSIGRYYKVSGLEYIFHQALKLQLYKWYQHIYFLFNSNETTHKLYPARNLIAKHNLKYIYVQNINDRKVVSSLRKIKPDIIVSVFFNQILKEDIIKLSSMGVINIHPGYLPEYKGVSPVFWAIANGEDEAGVTIHFIDKGVDTGGIIKRKKIRIQKEDTEDSLYWKLSKVGKLMLIDAIKKLAKGKIKTISNKNGSYYSIPSRAAVEKYKVNSKSFFVLRDYLSKD